MYFKQSLCSVLALCCLVFNFGFLGNAEAISVPGEEYQPDQWEATAPIEYSLKAPRDANLTTFITLEDVDMEVFRSSIDDSPRQQIGISRPINRLADSRNFNSEMKWIPLNGGGHTSTLVVASPGALSLRIGIIVNSLPQEAELRFFEIDIDNNWVPTTLVSGEQINRLLELNQAADPTNVEAQKYWSPIVSGEALGVELYLPPGILPTDVDIAIPQLSHFGISPFLSSSEGLRDEGYGDSNICQNDATCYSAWLTERKTVAKMIFTVSGSSYICTGTLLNDIDTSSYRPYFITANHCIDSQIVASSLITLWYFESDTCNSGIRNPSYTTRSGGAVLLWTDGTSTSNVDSNQDATLLELIDAPPSGSYFSGWDTAIDAGEMTGIHHPKGDWKKISFADQAGSYKCYMTSSTGFRCSSSSSGSFLCVDWIDGGTEGGSSGSGIFQNDGKLVGMLKGGDGACAGSQSYYSKFSIAYSTGNLSQWLYTSTGCTYSISPASKSFTSSGGSTIVTVDTNSSTCNWTASESLSWVSLSRTSGTGDGSVTVTVYSNNSTSSRTGTVTIAGKSFSILQIGEGGENEDWSTAYNEMIPYDNDLAILRQYRDEILKKNEKGQFFNSLIYRYSEKALQALLDNPELMDRAKELINANIDAVKDVLNGEEGVVYHTRPVSVFLKAYAAKSPQELKNVLLNVDAYLMESYRKRTPFFGFALE